MQTRNQYLDYLVDPSFQGENRLFVLSFENNAHRKSYKRYFLPIADIKDSNVTNDGQNFFDQQVKKIKEHMITLEHYIYFKNYRKTIAIDLSKQQILDADPNAIQKN